MFQKTLDNILSKICPNCKKRLKVHIISKDKVILWCPTCDKEYEYAICQECCDIYLVDEYKLCKDCRQKAVEFLTIKT